MWSSIMEDSVKVMGSHEATSRKMGHITGEAEVLVKSHLNCGQGNS